MTPTQAAKVHPRQQQNVHKERLPPAVQLSRSPQDMFQLCNPQPQPPICLPHVLLRAAGAAWTVLQLLFVSGRSEQCCCCRREATRGRVIVAALVATVVVVVVVAIVSAARLMTGLSDCC